MPTPHLRGIGQVGELEGDDFDATHLNLDLQQLPQGAAQLLHLCLQAGGLITGLVGVQARHPLQAGVGVDFHVVSGGQGIINSTTKVSFIFIVLSELFASKGIPTRHYFGAAPRHANDTCSRERTEETIFFIVIDAVLP